MPVPRNCTVCPFEASCDTAMGFADCQFYDERKEKKSFIKMIKKLFGKIFN